MCRPSPRTAESGGVKLGDTVAMFAQGPIGLCATAGARLRGAGFIIAVESDPVRAAMAKPMGADVVVDHIRTDAVEEIRRMTGGKGVDVAIEALGTQATFPRAMDQFAAERYAQELSIRYVSSPGNQKFFREQLLKVRERRIQLTLRP